MVLMVLMEKTVLLAVLVAMVRTAMWDLAVLQVGMVKMVDLAFLAATVEMATAARMVVMERRVALAKMVALVALVAKLLLAVAAVAVVVLAQLSTSSSPTNSQLKAKSSFRPPPLPLLQLNSMVKATMEATTILQMAKKMVMIPVPLLTPCAT
jgi:hypothetical protein